MRWFFRTHDRRLWFTAGYGIAVIVSSTNQPIVGDLIAIEDLIVFVGILLALGGLFGLGPLREKPTPIDQLDQLGQQWRAGQMTDDQFEAQKRRILNL